MPQAIKSSHSLTCRRMSRYIGHHENTLLTSPNFHVLFVLFNPCPHCSRLVMSWRSIKPACVFLVAVAPAVSRSRGPCRGMHRWLGILTVLLPLPLAFCPALPGCRGPCDLLRIRTWWLWYRRCGFWVSGATPLSTLFPSLAPPLVDTSPLTLSLHLPLRPCALSARCIASTSFGSALYCYCF